MGIAFVFPGQGAQYCGMGKEIIEYDNDAKAIFEKAKSVLDFDLEKICFFDADKINITEYTQPAILTISIAILKTIEKMGIKPNKVAGLSLGEYTALVANKAIDFETAVMLVRKRGLFMEEAAKKTEGAMAAVIRADIEKIKEILTNIEGYVDIANYNSPQQVVISGEREAVKKAIELLTENKIRVVPLKVSGAFHSKLMDEAANKLKKYLENIEIKEFGIPYLSNVTGAEIKTNNNTKELLVSQVVSSVRWEQCVENMIENGIDTFIEIGPGKTLAGLIKKIDRKKKVISVSDVESLQALKSMVENNTL